MLVFGDASRSLDPQAELARMREAARLAHGSGIEAHAQLVGLFIDAAELAQGIIDADFAENSSDRQTVAGTAATKLVLALAAAVFRSWVHGDTMSASAILARLRRLEALDLPDRVVAKEAEGYAFYALYPEAYLAAAEHLHGLPRLRVIGIRSIGLGLASLVASAAAAPPPRSVRPIGHPFERRLAPGPGLRRWLSRRDANYAVVDEGPGLSGSSFGAVLDVLEANGIPEDRIHVFPSHGGNLGHHASTAHHDRWSRLKRHVAEFESVILDPPEPRHRLEGWFHDLTGMPRQPLQDLSGGAWRTLHYPGERHWPAANPQSERRKYLLTSARGEWLLKFAGLGRYGERKLPRAAALAEAGFSPPLAGLRHGLTAERWLAGSRPLRPVNFDRERLLARVGGYLAFRARAFTSPEGNGANLTELAAMLAHNAREGISWAGETANLTRHAERLQGVVVRVATDNRVHLHEWLELPDGRILKTDALDHCEAHDLVGCQDIAWDIAGAAVEFGCSAAETEELARRVELGSGEEVHRELLRFLTPCYLAFQLGAATMARDSLGWAPREAERFTAEVRRYGAALEEALTMLG